MFTPLYANVLRQHPEIWVYTHMIFRVPVTSQTSLHKVKVVSVSVLATAEQIGSFERFAAGLTLQSPAQNGYVSFFLNIYIRTPFQQYTLSSRGTWFKHQRRPLLNYMFGGFSTLLLGKTLTPEGFDRGLQPQIWCWVCIWSWFCIHLISFHLLPSKVACGLHGPI